MSKQQLEALEHQIAKLFQERETAEVKLERVERERDVALKKVEDLEERTSGSTTCHCPEFCSYHARKNFDDQKETIEQLSGRLSDEVFPLDAEDLHKRLEACVDAVVEQLEQYAQKFPGRGVPTALLRLRERLSHLRDGGTI